MTIQKLNDAKTSLQQLAEAVQQGDVLLVKSEFEYAATRLTENGQLFVVMLDRNPSDTDEGWLAWMSIPIEILGKLMTATNQKRPYKALDEVWAFVEYMGGWSDDYESVFSERSPIHTPKAIELLGYDWRPHLE